MVTETTFIHQSRQNKSSMIFYDNIITYVTTCKRNNIIVINVITIENVTVFSAKGITLL